MKPAQNFSFSTLLRERPDGRSKKESNQWLQPQFLEKSSKQYMKTFRRKNKDVTKTTITSPGVSVKTYDRGSLLKIDTRGVQRSKLHFENQLPGFDCSSISDVGIREKIAETIFFLLELKNCLSDKLHTEAENFAFGQQKPIPTSFLCYYTYWVTNFC